MIRLAALACGLLCGIGVVLSGLALPETVKGFLNIAGAWRVAPVVVLLVALLVLGLAVRCVPAVRRALSNATDAPEAGSGLGRRILGSLLFGAGWGLAGYTPGTALVAAGLPSPDGLGFLAAVLVGLLASDRIGTWLGAVRRTPARTRTPR